MGQFEGLSVGLAELEVVLFLIERRKHRSSMTGSESNESLTPTADSTAVKDGKIIIIIIFELMKIYYYCHKKM